MKLGRLIDQKMMEERKSSEHVDLQLVYFSWPCYVVDGRDERMRP